mmetsp:Transcript_57152/g.131622  ORF Transcript_57152/g.131622 Transcript_57152/m.131622 type:complete len:418 (-) Transcript_57152:120-1373(-)
MVALRDQRKLNNFSQDFPFDLEVPCLQGGCKTRRKDSHVVFKRFGRQPFMARCMEPASPSPRPNMPLPWPHSSVVNNDSTAEIHSQVFNTITEQRRSQKLKLMPPNVGLTISTSHQPSPQNSKRMHPCSVPLKQSQIKRCTCKKGGRPGNKKTLRKSSRPLRLYPGKQSSGEVLSKVLLHQKGETPVVNHGEEGVLWSTYLSCQSFEADSISPAAQSALVVSYGQNRAALKTLVVSYGQNRAALKKNHFMSFISTILQYPGYKVPYKNFTRLYSAYIASANPDNVGPSVLCSFSYAWRILRFEFPTLDFMFSNVCSRCRDKASQRNLRYHLEAKKAITPRSLFESHCQLGKSNDEKRQEPEYPPRLMYLDGSCIAVQDIFSKTKSCALIRVNGCKRPPYSICLQISKKVVQRAAFEK